MRVPSRSGGCGRLEARIQKGSEASVSGWSFPAGNVAAPQATPAGGVAAAFRTASPAGCRVVSPRTSGPGIETAPREARGAVVSQVVT